MQKNHTCKFLAVGIIVLFIGVGIHPAFAIDIKQPLQNEKNGEDCGCEEVSDTDLIKVDRLLNRVEVYTKLLLVVLKYHPEVIKEYEELSNEISTIKLLCKNLISKSSQSNFFITCIKLLIFIIILLSISHSIFSIAYKLSDENDLKWLLFNTYGVIYYFTIPYLNSLGEGYDCWWYPYDYIYIK